MTVYLLEVAVSNVDDAVAAWSRGADRLELNAALELGGLTPPAGLVHAVRASVPIPIIAMIRPRAAGFTYSDREIDLMCDEIGRMGDAGVDGCAVGALHYDGSIHAGAVARFRSRIGTGTFVFHRAFDVSGYPSLALPRLIDLGVDRVMTSGGAMSAEMGIPRIRSLREIAGARLEILPAAGIGPHNAATVLADTGCRQLHGTFRMNGHDPAGPVASPEYVRLDEVLVADMRSVLDSFAAPRH